MNEIKLARTNEDIKKICDVLLQLRPVYTAETLQAQIKKQQDKHDFQIAYLEKENKVLSVAGFVIVEKLAWGKSLYIDDLVTDENSRSQGSGKAMIDWLKQFAQQNNCTQLHLDSRIEREHAHRFYEREGFKKASYHFSVTKL